MEREEPPLPESDARALRWLRTLVTVLTLTMIAGMVTLVALFWARLPGPATELSVPDRLSLPPEATVVSVSRGADWWAVALADGTVVIYEGDATEPTRRLSVPR